MPTSEQVIDPGVLSEEERAVLREQLGQLSAGTEEGAQVGSVTLQIEGKGNVIISLPDTAARALFCLLSNLAEGRAVSIADADEELTTREAAELLNVSRPHLVGLLKDYVLQPTVGSRRTRPIPVHRPCRRS